MSESPDFDQPVNEASAVIFFDGVCNLCNASVRFVIARDPRRYFRFASLQSDAALRILPGRGHDPALLSSVVLLEGGRLYERSTAALRIARHLRGPWPALSLLLVIPRPLRDFAYDRVANNRYRWFGRQDSCMVPTPALRDRFVED